MKGGNGKVAYIDTEGTLYPSLVAQPSSSNVTYIEPLSLNSFKESLFAILFFSLTNCNLSRPDRIVPIATRFGMDAGAVLDNVIIF